MMIRSFLPVGQGAFYCECFEGNVNVVYDCGSLPDKGIVEKEIKGNFRQGEEIDAVFISHLDEDHMNGIPFLLQYCNVKKIYFPLITQEDRKFVKMGYHINGTYGFSYNFLENPRQAIENISPESRLFSVRAEEGQEDAEQGIEIVESGSDISGDIGRSSFHEIYGQWLYIPFNFRQRDRVDILLNKLKDIFKREIKTEEVEKLWRNGNNDDREKIKKAYKKVPGGLNTNSMTLFSGTRGDVFRQFKVSCCSCRHSCFRGYCDRPAGCLYMGDYDASGARKWDELFRAYRTYWKQIGCVQIPHHGSSHNFNDNFLDMDVFFVISAGNENRYRHPHGTVVKKLLMSDHVPNIVTEHIGSAVHFKIY